MENQLKTRPLWQRILIGRVMDKEAMPAIYGHFNAAVDAQDTAMIYAFSANDPAILTGYMKKAEAERQARKAAHGFIRGVVLTLKGGPEKVKWVAELFTDLFLEAAMPDYSKLVPRYHLFVSDLNVLRAALAVKSYASAHRRLPDSLGRLVPAQLAAQPQDPFNKFAPLSYSASGRRFTVYGFGPDSADNKGAAALDQEAYSRDAALNAGDVLFAY
jgi:hypothetical protein